MTEARGVCGPGAGVPAARLDGLHEKQVEARWLPPQRPFQVTGRGALGQAESFLLCGDASKPFSTKRMTPGNPTVSKITRFAEERG